MGNPKRYYWLKLNDDFFDEKYVKALRRLPQGDSLVIVYLKMQLKSLKTEGIIRYEGIMPDCLTELAMVLDEDENVTKLAVESLIRFGAIERWENDTLYMVALQEFIGSETDSAIRVRKHRALKSLQEQQKALQSVTTVLQCNGEKDIELDINIEEKKEIKKRTTASVDTPKKKYGTYSHILLTETQYKKLVADFGEQYANACINGVDEYIQMKGAKYKDHNLVIRKAIREGWSCIPERAKEQVKTAREIAGDKAQEEWKEKELLLSNPRYAELDKRVRQLTLASVNGENVAEELLACKDEMSRLRNKILKGEV